MTQYKYLPVSLIFLINKSSSSFQPTIQQCTLRRFLPIRVTSQREENFHKNLETILFQSKIDEPQVQVKTKVKGVYSRPSAAIEKGSGFFVPGLEGSKVRVLFGLLVLILNYVNHLYSAGANVSEVTGFAFSEKIATFYGIFLLFQGIIEFGKENGLGLDNNNNTGTGLSTADATSRTEFSNQRGLEQIVSPFLDVGDNNLEGICWAAASYLALTPATNIMLIESYQTESSNGTVLYRLGEFAHLKNMSDESIQSSINAAIDTVYQSKGGRISIPSDYSAASLLPESNRRCVLLQQINQKDDESGGNRRLCLLVGSNQLLAAFTKNDLKWLGSLSKYISMKLR